MNFALEELDSTKSEFRILGLGSPVVDQVFKVEEEFLKEIEGEKGGSMVIDINTLNSICFLTKQTSPPIPGGSAANTIIGLSQLGSKCSFIGIVGRDEMGTQYKQKIEQLGVTPLFAYNETGATSRVICLVTPDGQRTMRCFFSCELNSSHIQRNFFQGAHLIHCEGYSLYHEDGKVTRRAFELAKEEGVCISLDLASFELVRRYRSLIENLLRNYVNIVFCNEDEAKEFHQTSIEDACDYLANLCDIAVVMLGPKGCYVQQGSTRIFVKTNAVRCIDATGAGDLFASGFLHRYLRGYSLKECCELGHILGREIVQVYGAQLPQTKWGELNQLLSTSEQAISGFQPLLPPKRTLEKDELYSNFPLSSSF